VDAFRKVNIIGTARQFGEPTNALMVNARLINAPKGLEFSAQPVTWANFYNPMGEADKAVTPARNAACQIDRGAERRGPGERDESKTGKPNFPYLDWNPDGNDPLNAAGAATQSCLNLITAQDSYDFLEPSLNDAFPVVGSFIDDNRGMVSVDTAVLASEGRKGPGAAAAAVTRTATPEFRGVDAVSATIQRSGVINEWTSKGTGTYTNWVVTFPTKSFYVDSGPGRQFALVNPDRLEGYYPGLTVPYPPFAQAFSSMKPGQSCQEVVLARYDRNENAFGGSNVPIPSPAPADLRENLCYEANVLTFGGVGVPGENLFDSALALNIDVQGFRNANGSLRNPQPENGWMKLNLASEVASQANAASINGGIPGGLGGYSGLPVIGFAVKVRVVPGAPKDSYASSVPHGYERLSPPEVGVAGALGIKPKAMMSVVNN
jgi:hypothetical protein